MNYTFTSLSIGTIAALALMDVGLGVSSRAVAAVDVSEVSAAVKAEPKARPGSMLAELEKLDLTVAQQDEIEAIKADMTVQLAEVLTPSQMEAFQQRQSEGGDMRSLMMSLDRGQRSSVMTIMRAAQSNLMDVLTPEQRAQVEGDRPLGRN
ncbi:MAG: Spy/CpxP family protein refolding chaperone [Cyanobacteria bacterium J06614_10]